MTDNAKAYRVSRSFRDAVTELAAHHTFTRAYRPQTNGKVERFNKTLVAEWAYNRPYMTNGERVDALDEWLHHYNHHRPHTALDGRTPMQALEQHVPGKHT